MMPFVKSISFSEDRQYTKNPGIFFAQLEIVENNLKFCFVCLNYLGVTSKGFVQRWRIAEGGGIYILQPGTDYFRNLSLSLSLMPDRIKSTWNNSWLAIFCWRLFFKPRFWQYFCWWQCFTCTLLVIKNYTNAAFIRRRELVFFDGIFLPVAL
jgi:hypothetical protein